MLCWCLFSSSNILNGPFVLSFLHCTGLDLSLGLSLPHTCKGSMKLPVCWMILIGSWSHIPAMCSHWSPFSPWAPAKSGGTCLHPVIIPKQGSYVYSKTTHGSMVTKYHFFYLIYSIVLVKSHCGASNSLGNNHVIKSRPSKSNHSIHMSHYIQAINSI